MTQRSQTLAQSIIPPPPAPPLTRAGCIDGPRPCPYMRCRYHLAPERSLKKTSQQNPYADATCALDLADGGGMTLQELGDLMGLSKERVRQIEARALDKLKTYFPQLATILGVDAHAYDPQNVPQRAGETYIVLNDGTRVHLHKSYTSSTTLYAEGPMIYDE